VVEAFEEASSEEIAQRAAPHRMRRRERPYGGPRRSERCWT
jgi:hypothetical protein